MKPSNTIRRFGGPSDKPKGKTRGRTEASKKELAARTAHEDYKEAREIAKLYDDPFGDL